MVHGKVCTSLLLTISLSLTTFKTFSSPVLAYTCVNDEVKTTLFLVIIIINVDSTAAIIDYCFFFLLLSNEF